MFCSSAISLHKLLGTW